MSRYQGPTFEVFPGRPLTIRDGDRVLEIRTEADAARARALGYQVEIFEPGPRLSRTPYQDHIGDPLVVDPRPIRPLDAREKAALLAFIRAGAYLFVAGFETWRGRDRWLYVDVLGVSKDPDDPTQKGIPVGPLNASTSEAFNATMGLRMVGDQLALRMADPLGRSR